MLTLIGVLLFVVLLLASVAIHEFGHLLTAKAFGMKATEYFVGFGPKLWSFRRGETEYGFKAIPAGGYVRIVGMTDLEELDSEDDRKRAFYTYSAPKKLVVLSAGSISHMFVAFFLFVIAFMAIGTYTATTTIGSVQPCIKAAGAPAGECTATDPVSPAKAAGLQEGDRILAVGGTPIAEFDEASRLIRANGAQPLEITIERAGVTQTVTAQPATRDLPDLDDPSRTVQAGFLGVGPKFDSSHDGPIAAADRSLGLMWDVVVASGEVVTELPDKIGELFDALGGDERDKEGLSGVVGAARVSGEFLSLDQASTSERISLVLLQVGALNVFIGLFNALPLLPLDGGHMAVASYEAGKRRMFRRLGRPDPGRVDMTKLLPATYVFVAVLIGLTVLLLAADIVNPITVS